MDKTQRQRAWTLFRECLAPRRRLLAVTFGVVLLYNLLELSLPKLLQLFVDSIAGHTLSVWGWDLNWLARDEVRLYAFPLLLLTLAALRYGLSYARHLRQAQLGQEALFDLRSRTYDQVQRLSFAYHDQVHSGQLISNVVEDVGHIAAFFQRGLFPCLEVGASFLCVYGVMAAVCWPAALVSLSLMALAALSVLVYFHYGTAIYDRSRRCLDRMVSGFSEAMEGHLLVRAYGRRAEVRTEYEARVSAMHAARYREVACFSALNQAFLLPTVFGVPAVLATALWLQSSGWTLSAGTLFLLFYLQNMLVFRMRWSSRIVEQWMRFHIAAGRLRELFETEIYLPDGSSAAAAPCPRPATACCRDEAPPLPEGALALHDVWFRYSGSPDHAIQGVDLSVPPGATVAFVGETGAGKTTLALLLSRFYDPERGTVTLGGRDLRALPLAAIRSAFALVFQDAFLFSASIRENIAYGQPCADQASVERVARLSHAHDFIMRFPEGYETRVGEKGVTLSGGQRQRLCLARALLRPPRFLLLDDATSSLDTATEQAIQESLTLLPPATTRLIVAHRWSSIAKADRIYVLERGRIIEDGTPAELRRPGTALCRILQLEGGEG